MFADQVEVAVIWVNDGVIKLWPDFHEAVMIVLGAAECPRTSIHLLIVLGVTSLETVSAGYDIAAAIDIIEGPNRMSHTWWVT